MQFLKSKIFLTLIFFGWYFFFPINAHAKDFQFDYQVYYQVRSDGITQVKHQVTVTNLVSDYYTQSFTLNVASSKILNVSAHDSSGNLTPQITAKDKSTIIKLTFNDKVAGLGKQLHFEMLYDTPEIATKKGKIWEVIIPGTERDDQLGSYNVYLNVPSEFGSPTFIYPSPNSKGFWTLDELHTNGINIIYGTQQNYSYNLIYYLSNKSSIEQIQEITLPPDTAFQKVILNRLSEIPQNITSDHDGNWIASYKIAPKSSLKIVAEGQIIIQILPDTDYSVNLTENDRQIYTKSQTFWENTQPIQDLAGQLQYPKSIYDWVVNHLSYNFDLIKTGTHRNGAAYILEHPDQAACLDFSDLFVAIARSAHIPAREVHGFAYTTNSSLQPLSLLTDVLHAWPEYYDESRKMWIPIDPTWGNTTHGIDYFDKLDFNHITLAILGENSDYPYPAGAFVSDNATKNVFIDVLNKDIVLPVATYSLELEKKDLISGLKNNTFLKITNTGSTQLMTRSLQINSDMKLIYDPQVSNIPPLGHLEIPVSFTPKLNLLSHNEKVEINYSGSVKSFTINVRPIYLLGYPISLGFIFCGIILIVLKYGKHRT